MKKTLRYMSLGIALMIGAGMVTSCDDSKDNSDFVTSPADDGAGAYFPASVDTDFMVTDDETDYSFPLVYRPAAGGKWTVPITVTPADEDVVADAFTFDNTVTFEEGKIVAPITFTCDASKLEREVEQQFIVEIDPAYDTELANGTVVITIYREGLWELLGNVTYTDYEWGISNYSYSSQVECWRSLNESTPNLYRIANPYQFLPEDSKKYFQFQILQEGEQYLGYTVPQTGIVAFNDFRIDFYAPLDEDLYILFPGEFQGFTPDTWVYNYVDSYQEDGTFGAIVLSPIYFLFNSQQGIDDSMAEPIKIEFEGYEIKDNFAFVTYNGLTLNPDGSYVVLADVELGTDVDYAKVAIVPGTNISEEVKQQIADGTIASTTIRSNRELQLSFDPDSDSGIYSIVALTYIDEEYQRTGFATFAYTANKYDEWEFVVRGVYTHLSYWADFGFSTEVVSLYESTVNPGKFRIPLPAFGSDLIFYMLDNGDITVVDQPTYLALEDNDGTTYQVFVDDVVNYFNSSNYGHSYLEDGVYNFDVVYYISDGYLDYGYEKFTPSVANTMAGSLSTRSTEQRVIKVSNLQYHKYDIQRSRKFQSLQLR